MAASGAGGAPAGLGALLGVEAPGAGVPADADAGETEQPNRMAVDEGGAPAFAPLDEHPDGQSPMQDDLAHLPPGEREDAERGGLPPGASTGT